MEPITEEQEKAIDNSRDRFDNIVYKKNKNTVYTGKDICMYGEIDFNNPDDIKSINKFNLVNESGSFVYSGFNYDTADCDACRDKIMFYQTFNPVLLFMFCHVLIGKPQRIIVYKKRKPKNRNRYV